MRNILNKLKNIVRIYKKISTPYNNKYRLFPNQFILFYKIPKSIFKNNVATDKDIWHLIVEPIVNKNLNLNFSIPFLHMVMSGYDSIGLQNYIILKSKLPEDKNKIFYPFCVFKSGIKYTIMDNLKVQNLLRNHNKSKYIIVGLIVWLNFLGNNKFSLEPGVLN